MRILVATDGLPHSDRAMKFADTLLGCTGGEMAILTVLKRRDPDHKAEAIFDRAAGLLRAERNYAVRHLMRKGNSANAIVQEANQGDYDLVVLGWSPVSGYLRLLRPTVERVIDGSIFPVAIVKKNGKPIERVLICDSGALEKPLLIRFKEHLSDLFNCNPNISVLHVMSQMSAGPGLNGWQLEAGAKELIEAHTPEGTLLERDIEMMEMMRLHPQPIIRHGFVVEEILAEARKGDYDLVVIGAHQGSGGMDMLLDDIEHQLISHIDRTILVVK
jgi:nucleotide-binding universal stress UspA family protein